MKTLLTTTALAAMLVSGAATVGNADMRGKGVSGPNGHMSSEMGQRNRSDDDYAWPGRYDHNERYSGRRYRSDDDDEYETRRGGKHGMRGKTHRDDDDMDDYDHLRSHGQRRG